MSSRARLRSAFLVVLIVGAALTGAVGPVSASSCDGGTAIHLTAALTFNVGSCDSGEDAYTSSEIQTWKQQDRIEDQQTITDLKALAASQLEKQNLHLTVRQNYLNDTETVAWSKAEAAMVAKMQNDSNATAAEVRQVGIEAIEDYYARHQMVMAEAWNGSLTSAEYIERVAKTEDGLDESIVRSDGGNYQGGNYTATVTLTNGTSIPVRGWESVAGKQGTVSTGAVIASATSAFSDFENGSAPLWDLNSGASVVSSPEIRGNYTMKVDTSGGDPRAGLPATNPSSFSTMVRPTGSGTEGSLTFRMALRSGTTNRLVVTLRDIDGSAAANLQWENGDGITKVDTGIDLQYNQNYKIHVTGMDWANASTVTPTLTVFGDNGTKIGSDQLGNWSQNSGTVDEIAWTYAELDAPVYVDNVSVEGSLMEYSKLYVADTEGSENQTIMSFEEYGQIWSSINQTTDRLETNFATYANRTHDAWQNGTYDPSDFISRSTLAQEYATDYNETGALTHAAASLATLGLSTPNLSSTSHMVVDYTARSGSNQSGTYTGLVMSQQAPSYNSTNLTDGRWYVNRTYDTANISGSQMLLTADGQRFSMNGTFVISEMKNRNGTSISSTGTQDTDYQSYSSDDYQSRMTELADLRAQLEKLEPTYPAGTGSTGGGGGFGGAGGSMMIGAVFVLAAAFIVLRGDQPGGGGGR